MPTTLWINCYFQLPLLAVNNNEHFVFVRISHLYTFIVLYSFLRWRIYSLFCVNNLRYNCVDWKSRKMFECSNTIYTDVKVHWPVRDMTEYKFCKILNNFERCDKIPATIEKTFFFSFIKYIYLYTNTYMYSLAGRSVFLEHRYDVSTIALITHVLGFCATFVHPSNFEPNLRQFIE